MNKFFASVLVGLFAVNVAYAQAPAAAPAAGNCEAQAVSKSGKPLAGAAKTAFMKKCEGGSAAAAPSACEGKAVSKSGKPLAGAAKTAFMKKCEADAAK
jgi:hypothetical protein